MNKKLLVGLLVISIGVIAFILTRKPETPTHSANQAFATPSPVSQTMRIDQVPAHYEDVPSLNSLAATLAPETFTGQTREAYQAAKAIPQTIAQMPCYCYCDRGMGHKSLHSCFEDDHAAHCAVCTNEALMAYRLQKQGLSPKQIREQIIAEFSQQ